MRLLHVKRKKKKYVGESMSVLNNIFRVQIWLLSSPSDQIVFEIKTFYSADTKIVQ